MEDLLRKIADGRTDLILNYLRSGGKGKDVDSHGIKLIRHCAYYGDVTAVKILLDAGGELMDLGDNLDLNGAVFHGHWQLCQFLIEQGADVNWRHPDTGESLLHAGLSRSSSRSTPVIVKLLLHYGIDVNVKTIPHQETGCFMRNVYTKGETALHRAAAFADMASIELLITAGADKTAVDINNESPIGWASWHGRPGKILGLLAHGKHGIHPLHEARMISDHGYGWGAGMMAGLVGELHL